MPKKLDRILVVDVESTCWNGAPPDGEESEIIEIGLCPVNVSTLEREGKHSLLVRPERSTISQFCTDLTTLTPEMFEDAGCLQDATQKLRRDFASKDRLWASWGDYDRRQFERVCTASGVGYPFGISHLNVKSLFAVCHGLESELGLDHAYNHLGKTMEGTHHRGDDDAWNIAGLLCDLLASSRKLISVDPR